MRAEHTPTAASPSTPASSDGPDTFIRLEGATVVRSGVRVLDSVSTAIGEGEFVAVIGPNGSGKSTLMRAMIGILPLAEGRAWIHGDPVRHRAAHDCIGYVPQTSAEIGNIAATAREAVSAGLLNSRSLFLRRDRRRVDEALDTVGISHLADRPITDMSGGQRQRVMIARALIRRPQVLLLDEPFTGVDASSQEQIAQLIGDLNAGGTTVIVVLHETGPLRSLLTRAILLEQGRIVHDGPVPDRLPHDPADDHHVDPIIEECIGQEFTP
ncbi:metal ABC transporter ATP-binding protein [Helcobacillus sp. ACRRO]|uniref:metal ABC transporter ATP-binding protein n=1 Tax=Helcobacillus sp. ACRRO TaxID=2918202 RepID=UPI001EF4104E|nr:metal ABC transporter ATP-binding protein [Helcobacillus sp. ACRRO]